MQGTYLQAARQPVDHDGEQNICISLDSLKNSKGMLSADVIVQRHEECTVQATAMCFIHSHKLVLVTLLNIVRHLWMT